MCGVAAIYHYRQSDQVTDADELMSIRDHMQKRGPDDCGLWLSADQKVGLAHRRLAIIDLNHQAAQPMLSADGQLVISFNGEIYNYRELRQRLQAQGYHFETDSDTEVLLHLYRQLGEEMLSQLRGMFAFTIWDNHQQALFLARDPYGIKPLYYADDGHSIRVASQVKALLAGGQISPAKDPVGIVGFYLLGSVPEPHTTWAGIKSLPAGSFMWVSGQTDGNRHGHKTAIAYQSIADVWAGAEIARSTAPTEHIQQTVRDAVLNGVKHHLVADVPVAVFLSAGVDSGAILGMMRQVAPDTEIQAVTLSFAEFSGTDNDESPLAEQVAKQYNAVHSKRVVTRAEFEADLPNIMAAMDQPTIDGINSWFVSKAASELGIKVALSGLGGDELFGGYPSFTDIPLWNEKVKHLAKVPLLGKLSRTVLSRIATGQSPKIAGLIEYGGSCAGAWLLRRGIYMPWELKKILPPDLVAAGLQQLNPVEFIAHTHKATQQNTFGKIATLEASLYMRNQLLRDSDWAGMAHSVEIRVPLVDIQLLQQLAPKLLNQDKIEGKKWLGRSPVNPLPEALINRPKTGFTTPVHNWMQAPAEAQKKWSKKGSKQAKYQHWSRTWLVNVAEQFNLVDAG